MERGVEAQIQIEGIFAVGIELHHHDTVRMGDEGLAGVFHAAGIVLDSCHSPSYVQCAEVGCGGGGILQCNPDIAHRHIAIAVGPLEPESQGISSTVILPCKGFPHLGQALFRCQRVLKGVVWLT